MVVRGKADTPNYRDFAFNLRIDADNFKVTNSTAKDNDLYYGKLFVDTHLRVKGDLNKPVVDGNIKVNKNTALTIVLPQSDPSIADREGIVEFIDQDAPAIDKRLVIAKDSLSQSKFRGFDVSVNIEINKEAELTMIIDEGNGDYLKLKGEAQLTGGIDESGKTTLTGRYELKEGTYEMTFNYLKRKFEIREGSYILWTGEPTTADINITAVYKSRTAPIDLLDDQLGDVSPAVRNTYKQRIPFETVLKMRGELLKPEITFDIVLPEGNYNVSSEIVSNTRTKLEQLRQQPDELNKQVFALLLLNRFIGENPFAIEAGVGAGALARQSVSKIMSQQLNNLAGNLIKGVELDFDLESSDDYTTGARENRTDLNVGVSKRLLDDRLKVTVGSSFGIEGPDQVNRDVTNIAGDVSLDYQLSKDGRYVLRAYRKNEYQVALQGQIIETGVAFIITMDYNKFRELFHRSEEEKELTNEMKQKRREERALKKAQEAQPTPPATTEEKKYYSMKTRSLHYFLFLLLILITGSCSSTRFVPEGDLLYVGGKVKVTDSSVSRKERKALEKEMKGLLRPKPNSRILGLRVKLFFYNLAKEPKKEKGFRYWLRNKVGEPPVLFSQVDLAYSTNLIQNYSENRGYFKAKASADSTKRGKRATAEYEAHPGRQYLIKEVKFPTDSTALGKAIVATQENTLLKAGDGYDLIE